MSHLNEIIWSLMPNHFIFMGSFNTGDVDFHGIFELGRGGGAGKGIKPTR